MSGTELGEVAVQNTNVAKRIVLIRKKENTKVCFILAYIIYRPTPLGILI